MTLPFEHDSLELLDACAAALLPTPAIPNAQDAPPLAQTAASSSEETLWQRFPDDRTVIKQPGSHTIGAYGLTPLTPMPENGGGFSVEALSRAVERDARRYDANA